MNPYDDDDDDEGSEESSREAPRTVMHDKSALLAMVSQLERQRPCLVVVGGRSSVGKIFRIRDKMVIGRTIGVDVLLEEDGVSRRHAEVKLNDDGSVEVVDLGSSNGTFFNGERVERRVLTDGDRIQVGNAVLAVLFMEEVDDTLQKNLYETAIRDSATHLFNRRYLNTTLAKEFSYARRYGGAVALIVFGVDHFKALVDANGEAVGIDALRAVARFVTESVSNPDALLARYGEEEFALVLPDTSPEDGETCAAWIRGGVATMSLVLDGRHIPVTVSVGVVNSSNVDAATPEEFLEAAVQCLYRARIRGRNRVEALVPVSRVS